MSTRITKEQRLPVHFPIAFVGTSGVPVNGIARELGRASLVAHIDAAEAYLVEEGGEVNLAFELPNITGEVHLGGRVARVREDVRDHGGQHVTAVAFELHRGDAASTGAVDMFCADWRPTVLVVDDEQDNLESSRRALRRSYHVLMAQSGEEALALFAQHEIAVVILDQMMPGMDGKQLLAQIQARWPGSPTVKVVMSGVTDPSVMRDFINAGRVFYFLQKPVQPDQLQAVAKSAIEQYWKQLHGPAAEPALDEAGQSDEARKLQRTQRILEYSRRLSLQRDLATAGRLAIEAVEELVTADRASYLIYDPVSDTLWSNDRQRDAVAGLTGFAARTATSIQVGHAGADARYVREIDDPQGVGDERIAVEPILGNQGQVLALLVALREAGKAEFSRDELETLKLLAAQCASAFGQMALQAQIEGLFSKREAAVRAQSQNLFRREAVDAYTRRQVAQGALLQLSPKWVTWTYRFIVAACVGAITYAVLGTINEYASGPAVVRLEGRTDLTATSAGIVSSVEVQPGQRVKAQQLLVRFYDASEQQDLERVNREFELGLVKVLRNPADSEARTALGALRAQKEFALSKLEARQVRAPATGVVSDVRIRTGEHLAPGEIVCSLVRDDQPLGIIAMLPGHYRPLLKQGMALRLELSGFRYAYRELIIESIGDEVIGPTEAKRFLGEQIADTVQLPPSVVLVRARLPSRDFTVEGRLYDYHDGMAGTAEARVRAEPILFTVIPGLKAIFEKHG